MLAVGNEAGRASPARCIMLVWHSQAAHYVCKRLILLLHVVSEPRAAKDPSLNLSVKLVWHYHVLIQLVPTYAYNHSERIRH